jgi:hypothetical protein
VAGHACVSITILFAETDDNSDAHHSAGGRRLADFATLQGSPLFCGVSDLVVGGLEISASAGGGPARYRVREIVEIQIDHRRREQRQRLADDHRSFRKPSQIEVFEGPGGLKAFTFEGTRARSRNKDGKNVPDATTAFKTVACLNVTLAHAKIGCAVLVVGSCADFHPIYMTPFDGFVG